MDVDGLTEAVDGELCDFFGQLPEYVFSAAADGVANGTNVDLPMPQDNDIADMIAAVEGNDMITVHLNSTLTKTSGAPGRFSADITTESGSTATDCTEPG